MAIHAQDAKVQVTQMLFQGRYADEYRFLDRAGAAINLVRKELPQWSLKRISQQLVEFQQTTPPLSATIAVGSVGLSRADRQSLAGAEASARGFGDEAELLYNNAIASLELVTTTRIGVRYHFLAPADSLEEADRATCTALTSPYQQAIRTAIGMDFVDGASTLVFEDPETGLRRNVMTSSVIMEQPPGAPPHIGFKVEEGSGGLMIDIDTFTRPATGAGHFPKLSIFIQEQFLKSKKIALDLMRWIIKPQR